MTHAKQFHVRFEDLAVPEICTDDLQEAEENSGEEVESVDRDASDYDGPALPEYHSGPRSAVRR